MKKGIINKEKILRIFIVLGLLAILISLYLQYLDPFLAEKTRQKRDKARIQNFSLINSAIGKVQKIDAKHFLDKPNTIYVSLPSDNPDCRDLKLLSLPGHWKYACKNNKTFRNTDGSGWLPIDFSKISQADFTSSLPIDPINAPANGYYYAYVASRGFALASLLESDKYIRQAGSKDNLVDPARLEIGSNLNIIRQLALFRNPNVDFNFNQNNGNVNAFIDKSGGIQTDKTIGNYFIFNDATNYLIIKDNPSIQNIFSNGGSVSAWVHPKSGGKTAVGRIAEKFNEKAGWMLYVLEQSGEGVKVGFLQRFSNNAVWKTTGAIPINSWSHLVVIYDNSAATNNPIIYLNGKKADLEITSASSGKPASDAGLDLYIGNDRNFANAFDGYLGETKIYNRILTEQEINALYKNLPGN